MKAFLSYPSEKLDTAREVFAFLRSIGVDVWFDKESLVAGEDWARAIKLALRSADMVVLICSAEVVSKAGVIQREVKDALEIMRDIPPGHIFLVALRTSDLRLPLELTERQYIDFFRPGWQLGLGRSVGVRLKQLDESPPAELLEYLDAYERRGGIEFRTLKREFPGFEADADYFVYRIGGEYWDYVTAEITSDIIGGYYKANAWAVFRDREMKAMQFELGTGMSWFRRAQEYFREGEFVSLQFDAWEFFGGAHGTRGVYTKNFGGPEIGALRLARLFSHETATIIRDFCAQAVGPRFGADIGGVEYLVDRLSNSANPWKPFSQWLFNRQGIRIWFSMYSDLPYVVGVFDVVVPWSILKSRIADDFRDTAFGAFVRSC